ncbi:MAG: hypothetical protein MJA27_11265, partial [Pseudanabaenales cyanobacterium]|nr:hypothetical protein [Pseudanabaenales cyanobacterium]
MSNSDFLLEPLLGSCSVIPCTPVDFTFWRSKVFSEDRTRDLDLFSELIIKELFSVFCFNSVSLTFSFQARNITPER